MSDSYAYLTRPLTNSTLTKFEYGDTWVSFTFMSMDSMLYRLDIYCPWRLICETKMICASADCEELPAVFELGDDLKREIFEHIHHVESLCQNIFVVDIRFDRKNITIIFNNGCKLEIFKCSSAERYSSWYLFYENAEKQLTCIIEA